MRWITAPFDDALDGLERVLEGQASRLLWVFAGLALGWWVYVPLHEFLHAIGCLATGGEVWELEIDGTYGGAFYAALFDWVTPESDYAGRLSGFDTGGSDLVYLATDLAPYLLTLFPGVWLWFQAAKWRRPLLWGGMVPVALAPFVSLTGDAYEIGSILATQVPAWSSAGARDLIRGDDLFLVASQLPSSTWWFPTVVAAVLGAVWSWSWYLLSRRLAAVLARPTDASA